MVDNGDGTFTIKNKTTGQTKRVGASDLPKFGLTAPTLSNEGAFQKPVNSALDHVPVVGGLLKAIAAPALKGGEFVAQAGGELGTALTGGTKAPQFVSPQLQQTLNNRTQAGTEGFTAPDSTTRAIGLEGAKRAAGAASYLPGGFGVKALGASGGLNSFSESDSNNALGLAADTGLGAIGAILGGKAMEGAGKYLAKKPFDVITRTLPDRINSQTAKTIKQIGDVGTRRFESLFGPQVLDTTPEGAIIAPRFASLFKKIGVAAEPSIQKIGEKLKVASETAEKKLTKALTKDYYNFNKTDLMGAVDSTLDDTVGEMGYMGQTKADISHFVDRQIAKFADEAAPSAKVAPSGSAPVRLNAAGVPIKGVPLTGAPGSGTQAAGPLGDEIEGRTPIAFPILLKLKRVIGEKADWGDTPVGLDPYQQLYHKLDDMIRGGLSNEDEKIYGNMMQDHSDLIKLKGRYTKAMNKGRLPEEVFNKQAAESKIAEKPVNDPAIQAITTLIGGGLGAVGGGLMAGPAGAAIGATGGGGAVYGAQYALRSLLKDPKIAAKVADLLANPASKVDAVAGSKAGQVSGKALQELLRQINIRVPGVLQGN